MTATSSNTNSTNGTQTEFPMKVTVSGIVRSRYPGGVRPMLWDDRVEGIDIVTLSDGNSIKLWCDGGQSTPKKGWVLMISGGNGQDGYRWTLYGFAPGAEL